MDDDNYGVLLQATAIQMMAWADVLRGLPKPRRLALASSYARTLAKHRSRPDLLPETPQAVDAIHAKFLADLMRDAD